MATPRHLEICCGDVSKTLTVLHHLEDIIVCEGGKAYLECEINGRVQSAPIWYKNGVELHFSSRIRSTNENKWHRLDIDPVVTNDYGIYTIVLQNNDNYAFSSACLYVGPPIGRNAVLYTCPCLNQSLTIIKPLTNVTIHTEQNIDLETEIRIETTSEEESIIWYKENKRIIANERTKITTTKTVSRLQIENAILSDTGIYMVVGRTKTGVISTTAIVQVLDVDLTSYNNKTPSISEHLPETIEINDDEELRLICKAHFDANTVVKWYYNNRSINSRHFMELSGSDYVGLKVSPENHAVKGKYKVVLENQISGILDTSECDVYTSAVTVSQYPFALPRKPLISAVAICGSEVTFDCSFEYLNPTYFYVVWYVGTIRVERSNTRFVVICKNGEYLLRIKKVEPCMAGEVICELRHFYYDHEPVLLGKASCILSIVPSGFLANEQRNTTFKQTRHPTIHSMEPKKDEWRLPTHKKYLPTSSADPLHDKPIHTKRPKTTLMELKYSRLEEDIFYYLEVTMRAPCMESAEIVIKKSPRMGGNIDHCRMFDLEWSEPDIETRTWYAIDIEQNGCYVEAGISSSPVFHIKDPVEGKDLRIRIRIACPLEGTKDASISIVPALPIQRAPSVCTLNRMELYEETYRDVGYDIGFGAFGRVMLTQDKSGCHYASKYVRTISEKKKKNALREFEIMCVLKHSKVIELVNAFSDNDGFTFVMEYLWGGELFSRIVEEDHIQEMDVVTYVRQICEALLYLHSLQIAHMDLKPENIMCLNPNSKQVKLVDFGLARVLKVGEITRVIYGSKDYVAPEVLGFEPLTVACDMWSLGVITYLMLSGVMPFHGDNWAKLSANITKVNYNFDDMAFKDISDLGKDFISSLLIYHPDNRMTASGALSHKWIVKGPPEGTRARDMKKTKDNLKSYLASKAKWQRAGNVMIAAHRLRTQASHRSSMERTSSGT